MVVDRLFQRFKKVPRIWRFGVNQQLQNILFHFPLPARDIHIFAQILGYGDSKKTISQSFKTNSDKKVSVTMF